MRNLSTYVAAIHGRTTALAVSGVSEAKSRYQDQGFEVSVIVTTFRFGNGVIIRRTVEQDEFPGEATCTECWITYEVVSGDAIEPRRQVFENACRESFWLKYHTGRLAGPDENEVRRREGGTHDH